MGKLIDVKNADQEKAFELYSEPDALYLNVKCSDNKHHHRVVTIKVSDAIYQIAKAVGPERWRTECGDVNTMAVR